MIDLQPVKGTRDFFPSELRLRNWLFEVWRKASLKAGFEEYDTCILEHEELYIRKAGDEISNANRMIRRFKKGIGRSPKQISNLCDFINKSRECYISHT